MAAETSTTDVTDTIDAIVNARIDPEGPGAAVAVIRDGAVIHARGYGLANLEWREPMAPDTVLCLGSTTKPFTATAVLLLEADGALALEDSIRTHLSELPAAYQPITIRQLLSHTGGVPNYVTRPGFWEHVATRDHSPEELLALFVDLPLDSAPGTDYSYSNSGYALLGLLIERLSGIPFADFVTTRIFAPLGMRDSRYMWHDTLIPRRAGGYERTADGYCNARYISPTLLSAGGGLGSTLNDLVSWDKALRGHRSVSAATQERMWTPARLANGQTCGYGLGWGLSTYRGRRVVHHSGGVPSFTAFYGRFMDDDLSVIVLSNRRFFDGADLTAQISNLVLGLPTPQREPVTLDADALELVAGNYRNVIGEALDVRRDGDGLAVSGARTGRFLPVDETTFYAADDPDVTLRFEEPAGGVFTQVTAVVPFYWFTARRQSGMASE